MVTMDQSHEVEDRSNNETKTESKELSVPKAEVESDTSGSSRSNEVANDDISTFKESIREEPMDTSSQEEGKVDSPAEESGQDVKEEETSLDTPFEDKGDKWKLKLDIYSSTSSSGNEDSEADEQKNPQGEPHSEKCEDSSGQNLEALPLDDTLKSDSECEFLGFEVEPDPSAMTAFYQKLIAKSEAAVDVDKWSSCSGSITSPYSEYNSDDGDQSNLSLHGRERYDTFSEKDEDDISMTPRNNDPVDYGDSASSSNFTGYPYLSSTPAKKSDSYSSSSKGKRHSIDANNPAFKVPFTLGWKREVVYRSTVNGGANNKRLADIYYYTPTGKKMRSSREVLEYLEETNSSLSVENFTFLKDCIHPDDPSLEIIREAKKISIKDDGTKKRHRSKSSTPTLGSPNPDWISESPSPRGSLKGKLTPVHHGSYNSKRRIFLGHGMSSGSGMYSPPWLNVSTNGSPRHEGDGGSWAGPSKSWKREVVYRSTVNGGANNKRLADIYYYTPTGKKMRSSREVLEYLEETNSSLSVENFTFLKDCIHPDDPSLEIIREAKKISIKDDGTKKRHRSKSSTPTLGSPNPDWISESPSPRGSLKGKLTPVHHGSYNSKRRIFLGHGMSSGSGMYSPPWLNVSTNGSPRHEGDGGSWAGPSKSKSSESIMPCSLRCPGLHGVVPNLQCQTCVCLYHPECVGGIPAQYTASTYICKECENALTSSAASQCLNQLGTFLGPSILRGRVEQHNPNFVSHLDANVFIAPL